MSSASKIETGIFGTLISPGTNVAPKVVFAAFLLSLPSHRSFPLTHSIPSSIMGPAGREAAT